MPHSSTTPIRVPSTAALLCTAALVWPLLAGTATAGGTHATVNYPSAETIGSEADRARNGFGRLFPVKAPEQPDGLAPHPSPRYDLVRLGEEMIDDPNGAQPSELPIGYVFLGQFIDHDLTFDTVTSFDELAVDADVANARTPDLDLDCVYGGGPERTPYLYRGPYLRTGALVVDSPNEAFRRYDLLRAQGGAPTALIGDPRNDENFAISQLQAAFVAYHNRMVDRLLEQEAEQVRAIVALALPGGEERAARVMRIPTTEPGYAGTSMAQIAQMAATKVLARAAQSGETRDSVLNSIDADVVLEHLETDRAAEEAILEEARALTIHHYHRVIVEDFVPRIIGIARTRDILENGRLFFRPNGFRNADGTTAAAFVPIEFAVAGYRFMHSQVPARMDLRNGDDGVGLVSADLFSPDKSGQSPTNLKPDGFTPVRVRLGTGPDADTGSLVISWDRFVDGLGEAGVQRANKIDTTLASPLGTLDKTNIVGPGGLGNLAGRNLNRGRTYALPSGQDLARVVLEALEARGSLDAIYESDFGTGLDAFVLEADDTTKETLGIRETPLWYYILQEAEMFGDPLAGAESASAEAQLPVKVRLYDHTASAEGGGVESQDPMRGATLGPVGATIVGETLIGLVDHYREMTGDGLDADVPLGYDDFPYGAALPSGPGVPTLSETPPFEVAGETFGRRYLLRNFLRDAGVAGQVSEDDVCMGVALSPSETCEPDDA